MDDFALLRAIVSLIVTLSLIVLLGWAWKRYGQPFGHKLGLNEEGASRKRIEILESRRLNPQTTLYLIREGQTEHLIATTAAQTTLISTHTHAKAVKVKS